MSGIQDVINLVLHNPLVSGATEYVKIVATAALPAAKKEMPPPPPPPPSICTFPLWKHPYSGSGFVRVAGLFGASAVVLGAYGAHENKHTGGEKEPLPAGIFEFRDRDAATSAIFQLGALYPKEDREELKKIYEMANRYHFLHSLALLGVPLCRWPKTSGTFLILGMTMFCGTCYYHALTGQSELRRLTPIGGTFLIIGWLAMLL